MKTSTVFRSFLFVFLLLAAGPGNGFLGPDLRADNRQVFQLGNNRLKCSVVVLNGVLLLDRLEPVSPTETSQPGTKDSVETDADFMIQVVWTGWQAPGKLNNAENPVFFSKKDFRLIRQIGGEHPDGNREMILFFRGVGHSLELRLTYQLAHDSFYTRRKLAIRDPESGLHFLPWIWSRQGKLKGKFDVLNGGGFGQPLAFRNDETGFFMGLEYPASENILLDRSANEIKISCGQEMGETIGSNWIEAEPVVMAITSQNRVKSEFMRYINDIRIAPLKPYTLYNTWYDLRAPEMVKNPENVLNEKNVMRIVESFEANMVKPFGLKLDAFVLDDGWDIYQSDWVLRPDQFPRGLKPIARQLEMSGTDLGIWIGPTGGYSNRNLRIEWMKNHGYETVGDQLCLAGTRYRTLLNTRVSDFIRSQGVGYFKWDGVQFSCSQSGHGHATGIYSRRAVMESLRALCQMARQLKPDIFLNVTSGTWLSPWWVKYANTIWMQGYDYGYANVPSISQRDRAMTYRDYVLYDGLRKNNFWFPLANLMTHGIIKGHLQKLGGEAEPLDRFTDNALLYFTRGVSMWELYISPDLLTEPEWEAIARAMTWAKDRFPILMSTEMVGGNPGEREAYGYLHVDGNRAILAVRNPYIEPAFIEVVLDESVGFSSGISGLVLKRSYPNHWISPERVGIGDNIRISLQGYETAIYELFPLKEAREPILADVVYQVADIKSNRYEIDIMETGEKMRLLNPAYIKEITCEGKQVNPTKLDFVNELPPPVLLDEFVEELETKNGCYLKVILDVDTSVHTGRLAVLMENGSGNITGALPTVHVVLDGQDNQADIQVQEKNWKWALIDVPPGRHTAGIDLSQDSTAESWGGHVSVWFLADQHIRSTRLEFVSAEPVNVVSLPGSPRPSGVLHRIVKLKKFTFQ